MGKKYQLNCSFSDGSTKSAGSFEIPDGEPALVYGAIVPQIPTPVVNIALPVSGFNRTPVIGDVVNIVCGANGRSGIAIGKITAVDSGNATCNITSFVNTTGAKGHKGDTGAQGASGVTDVTAGAPTEQDGYTVTPVTFNFEQGNSKTVNIQAKNGEVMLQSQTFTIAGGDENAVVNFSTAFLNFASTHNIVAAHIVQSSGSKLDFVLNGKNYSLNYPTFEYSSIGEAYFSGWVVDEDAPAEMFRGQILCLGEDILGFVGQDSAGNPEVTNINTQRGLSVIAYYQ